MLAMLGEAAFRTVLLIAAVQLGLRLLRIRQAQLLLIAWTVVLGASLAMPALQWATPVRFSVVADLSGTGLPVEAEAQSEFAAPQASGQAFAADPDGLPSVKSLLAAVYLLVTGTLLLRLVVGVALSFRLLGKATPVSLADAPGAAIRVSPDVTAPVTIANVILLPADFTGWPLATRRAVLAHEQAHVARWDFAMLLIAQFNRAVFWFSPLSWWLHRRLVALAELASDDHAMQVTGDRAGYAEVLLEMGHRSGPLLRGLAMARPATLRLRIERVLSDGVRPDPASRIQRALLGIAAACVSIAAAAPDQNAAPAPELVAFAPPQTIPLPPDPGWSSLGRPAESVAPTVAVSTPSIQVAPTPPSSLGVAVGMPQSHPVVRVAARPTPPAVSRTTLPLPPPRSPRQPGRIADKPHATEPPFATETSSQAGVAPYPTVRPEPAISPAAGAGEDGHAPAAHRTGHSTSEPPLLKLIDQQTCTGAYLPGPLRPNQGSWLTMIRTTFFRGADGRPWLTFYVGSQNPVTLPVTVKGSEVEFTETQNTVFTMLPKGTNHLTGTTQRPYGTVDVACGGSNAHLFDGRS